MAKQEYFNIGVDTGTTVEALQASEQALNSSKCSTLFFINAHCFNIAQRDAHYLDVLNASEFVYNDGSGIKLGAKFAKVKIQDNLNGTDLIPKVIELATNLEKKVFLLGTKDEILALAKTNLETTIPGLKLAGMRNGFFQQDEEAGVIDQINNSGAELLIVGMGVPYQEKWISKNKHALSHLKLIIAGGAVLDFLSGTITRAPVWMQKMGIEWLYRLWLEPKRLMKRYLVGNFVFVYYMFKYWLFGSRQKTKT